MWLHATSWRLWTERFYADGYDPVTPGWPEVPDSVAAARKKPDAQAGNGLAEVTAHFADFANRLDSSPILIGHSVGGFVVEKLLGEGVGRAGISIAPAQRTGREKAGDEHEKSPLSILGKSSNRKRVVSLTAPQFRYSIANRLSRPEADALFERWTIPSPARPLFELAANNLERHSPARIDTSNDTRGPLLLMATKRDRTVDRALVHSAYKKYRKSRALTELIDYNDRGHSLIIDSGAPRVIDDSLAWLSSNGMR